MWRSRFIHKVLRNARIAFFSKAKRCCKDSSHYLKPKWRKSYHKLKMVNEMQRVFLCVLKMWLVQYDGEFLRNLHSVNRVHTKLTLTRQTIENRPRIFISKWVCCHYGNKTNHYASIVLLPHFFFVISMEPLKRRSFTICIHIQHTFSICSFVRLVGIFIDQHITTCSRMYFCPTATYSF